MDNFHQITARLPSVLAEQMEWLPASVTSAVEEIRLRCGQYICIQGGNSEKIIEYRLTQEDLQKTLNHLIHFSYYAYEEDMAKGFVTIEGGHRVGICGKAVIKGGHITLIKEISSLNIRFAKEVIGCGEKLASQLKDKRGNPQHTLIVSPPGCGKTTLLRDLARIFSNEGRKVAICDERSELAGMYRGIPSFYLGSRTDVLDGCDKAEGIPILIRSMSPDVIVTDEIGKREDLQAIEMCLGTGVCLITSIHGSSREELMKSNLRNLIGENVFRHIIYLTKDSRPGKIAEVVHA